jgi:hypothetical protein
MGLSTQAKRLYDGAVSLDVIFLDVVEQASAPPNQHEQPSAGMVVLFVDLQMLGQILNAMGEQSNLDFGAAGVGIMQFIFFDQLLFVLGR